MKSPRPAMIHRAHGKPMVCPVCGNDVWADAPHVCPEGFVRPAEDKEFQIFYNYNSLNQCCAHWMLLGWPETNAITLNERGRMHFACPKCKKDIWFDMARPDAVTEWHPRSQGDPQPPALVQGRIVS